jgi:hypothetical protein
MLIIGLLARECWKSVFVSLIMERPLKEHLEGPYDPRKFDVRKKVGYVEIDFDYAKHVVKITDQQAVKRIVYALTCPPAFDYNSAFCESFTSKVWDDRLVIHYANGRQIGFRVSYGKSNRVVYLPYGLVSHELYDALYPYLPREITGGSAKWPEEPATVPQTVPDIENALQVPENKAHMIRNDPVYCSTQCRASPSGQWLAKPGKLS